MDSFCPNLTWQHKPKAYFTNALTLLDILLNRDDILPSPTIGIKKVYTHKYKYRYRYRYVCGCVFTWACMSQPKKIWSKDMIHYL